MKRIIIMLTISLAVFSGCANKIDVKCPSCDIVSNDGNTSFNCTECTIEATGSEDFSFFTLPRTRE